MVASVLHDSHTNLVRQVLEDAAHIADQYHQPVVGGAAVMAAIIQEYPDFLLQLASGLTIDGRMLKMRIEQELANPSMLVAADDFPQMLVDQSRSEIQFTHSSVKIEELFLALTRHEEQLMPLFSHTDVTMRQLRYQAYDIFTKRRNYRYVREATDLAIAEIVEGIPLFFLLQYLLGEIGMTTLVSYPPLALPLSIQEVFNDESKPSYSLRRRLSEVCRGYWVEVGYCLHKDELTRKAMVGDISLPLIHQECPRCSSLLSFYQKVFQNGGTFK